MLPAVAEVIFVADTLAYPGHVGEPHLGLLQVPEHAFRVGGIAKLTDPEHVHVVVLPAHGSLNHPVYPVEAKRRGDQHASPHRRVGDVHECDPHL